MGPRGGRGRSPARAETTHIYTIYRNRRASGPATRAALRDERRHEGGAAGARGARSPRASRTNTLERLLYIGITIFTITDTILITVSDVKELTTEDDVSDDYYGILANRPR